MKERKVINRLRNEAYMWYEYIDHVIFLKNLYRQVPELVHVRINKISLEDEGTKVAIVFDMPSFADNIPEKWDKLGYNSLCIEVKAEVGLIQKVSGYINTEVE